MAQLPPSPVSLLLWKRTGQCVPTHPAGGLWIWDPVLGFLSWYFTNPVVSADLRTAALQRCEGSNTLLTMAHCTSLPVPSWPLGKARGQVLDPRCSLPSSASPTSSWRELDVLREATRATGRPPCRSHTTGLGTRFWSKILPSFAGNYSPFEKGSWPTAGPK